MGDGEEVNAMNVFKLLPTETALTDDYPIIPSYVYICDGVFKRSPFEDEVTVGDWKKSGAKEIRRCDLFGHKGARLGDRAEP